MLALIECKCWKNEEERNVARCVGTGKTNGLASRMRLCFEAVVIRMLGPDAEKNKEIYVLLRVGIDGVVIRNVMGHNILPMMYRI